MAPVGFQSSPEHLFPGNSELAGLMRAFTWTASDLGPAYGWPQSLQAAIRILLTSRYAMWIGWGEQLTFLYNDAYRPTLGIKHPWALGAPARKVWAEIWPDIGPRIASVFSTGQATHDEGLLLFLERSGFREETYHTFSYSPLADETGAVKGILCVVTEETERVIGERRMTTLRQLASELAAANTQDRVFAAVKRQLSANVRDLPFSLTYLFEVEGGGGARLACATGVAPGHPAAPEAIEPGAPGTMWPTGEILRKPVPMMVPLAGSAIVSAPGGTWDKPADRAMVVPIKQQGQELPAGFLVAAVSPYRPYDAAYSGFIDLLAGQLAAAIANARAYENERKRAEALAEIDRAKTAFFGNISHEFRTPLTLMLAPIEDTLGRANGSVAVRREEMESIHRNGLRLLRLVNALLDFSRIEANRIEPSYEAADLPGVTAGLASAFLPAAEKAGLRLSVDCPPLGELVYVDRATWEKIVLNLLSNAFKFTFIGFATLEGQAEYVNPAGRRMVGLDTDEQVRATRVPEYLAEEERRAFEELVLPAVLREGQWEGETVFRNFKTGALIPTLQHVFLIREQGSRRPVAIATISRDITARKLAEEELQRSRAYLAEAQRLSHTASWAWDASTGKLLWSEEHFRIVGLNPGDMQPAYPAAMNVVHPEDRAAFQQAFEAAIREKADFETDCRIVRPDGTVRDIHSVGHPVFNESGEVAGYVGTIIDRTEWKHAEEALQKAQADLAHMARVTMMGELAASIAHEVNQPLSAVVTDGGACLGWLSGEEPNLAEARAAAERIIEEGIRASEVIARIRSLLKKSPPQMSILDLNEVINEVVTLTRRELLKHDIALRTELASDLARVRSDPIQAKQVVANLIINAIEATSGRPRRDLLVSSQNMGSDRILIAVCDSGVGIDPGRVEELFKPFVTTKPQGLGMGLAISRSIVEAHGGRLWAVPNADMGATFQFSLPVVGPE